MISVLASVLAKYHARKLNDYPFLPTFPGDELEDHEIAPEEGQVDRDYELPLIDWRAIPCAAPVRPMPMRFVDGSINARTIGTLTDTDGRQRPMLMAVVSAAALELEEGYLRRRDGDYEVDTILTMINRGLRRDDLDLLKSAVADMGIRLVDIPARTLSTDFELARDNTFDAARTEMLQAEKSLVLLGLDRPTVVDGVLEDRLDDLAVWDVPVVGVVKQLLRIRYHLHQAGINLVYTLRPGERTPAIVLQTHVTRHDFRPVVSWYLRLHGGEGIAPSWGVVRVAVPQEYFENTLGKDFTYLNELSGWLYSLRCRDRSYQRMPVSLEPVVRVEDNLRALRPSLDLAIGRFQAAAGLG